MADWVACAPATAQEAAVSDPRMPDDLHADLALAYPGFDLHVKLRLPGRGVSVLLGPSGCGKTTVLRALAGLSRARGRVAVGSACWQDDAQRTWVPVHRRPIGMVFQEASLFAHLSVRGNLDYGFKRTPVADRHVALDDAVALLGIGHLMSRRPEHLSGGERQRVAIARALLTSPRLLLMDEPLSALDTARKAEVLPFLERLNAQAGVPVVYVTHALDEAARLADHLVLMDTGRVRATGTPAELFSRLDLPLSHLDEAAAVVDATVAAHEPAYGQSRLDVGGLPLWAGLSPAAVGQRVRVRVLARDVSVALSRATDSSIVNILPATVASLRDDGPDTVTLQLMLGTTDKHHVALLLARLTRRSCDHLKLAAGQAVFAQVKGVALMG
jgi:molybdate transport system ATP-binding protein